MIRIPPWSEDDSGELSPSALLTAVVSWQRLVEQLAPYAEKNDDPSDVLARLLEELTRRREQP
jgi:hypothetical protein